jgi:hypothetical protein
LDRRHRLGDLLAHAAQRDALLVAAAGHRHRRDVAGRGSNRLVSRGVAIGEPRRREHRRTSSVVTRPRLPVGGTRAEVTPSCRASRRVAGVASTRVRAAVASTTSMRPADASDSGRLRRELHLGRRRVLGGAIAGVAP